MKKIITLVTLVATLILYASTLYAQTPDEAKFIGKWTLTVNGVPGGESKLPMTVTYEKEKLGGTINTLEGKTVKFKAVIVYDKVMSALFEAEGQELSLTLSLGSDGILTGSMMGFISITGEKSK
jgi:hypothetical protein